MQWRRPKSVEEIQALQRAFKIWTVGSGFTFVYAFASALEGKVTICVLSGIATIVCSCTAYNYYKRSKSW